VNEAYEVLDADFVMPLDEIRLGSAFSELSEPEKVAEMLLTTLFAHSNFHVRRVAIQAWRRIGITNVKGLREALLQALNDSQGWIVYDAAWAIAELGYDDVQILDSLKRVAGDVVYPDDEAELEADLSNSINRAKLQCAQTIYELTNKLQPQTQNKK